MRICIKSSLFLIFLLLFLIPFSSGKIVVVNSRDWDDVYSGLLYAKLNNLSCYFLNSPNPEGLLRILPKDKVLLIQSDNPYVVALDSILRSRGYEVSIKRISEGSIDLAPDVSTFCVVEKDQPVAALVTAPLAKLTNSWVLLVDSSNLPRIKSELNGKKVILVGYFKRNIKSVLDTYKSDEIIEPNKFKLSLKVATNFLTLHPTTQVLVADGRYIEEEMFDGHSPLIIVGSNLLPSETVEWLVKNNIKTCVVIGTQLTYIGEQIRSQTNKRVGVFIKFGQALPGSSIYALTMMPLPLPNLRLEVVSAVYDIENGKLFINLKNSGNCGLFELTTFRILDNGVEVASGGDREPYFIGSGENLVVSYDISLAPENLAKNLTVEFFTSYGESPDSLDRYLTEKGKFGPPLTKPLEIKKVRDLSLLNVTRIIYYPNYRRIGIEIENLGTVPAYFIIKLPEIKIQGIPTPLQSKITFIDKGRKMVFITASLDPIDIQENSRIKVIMDYGERKNLFVKSLQLTLPLEVSHTLSFTGFFSYLTGISIVGIGVVIVILVLIRKKSRRRRKRR